MVKAESSGVVFTVNPMTGDQSQVVVNAVYGLGEMLVSGEATPDQWILDKTTGDVLERSIVDKRLMSVANNGTVERIEVPPGRRQQPVVSNEMLISLKEVGVHLEKSFGYPQDLEWAIENGRLAILQSRAVTTTQPTADEMFRVSEGCWTRAALGEWLQLPLSPLFSTLVLPKLNDAVDSLLKERLRLRRPLPTWLVVNGFYYVRGDVVLTPNLLLTPICFVRDLLRVPDKWNNEVVPEHTRRISELREFNVREASTREILEHFEEVCATSARCWAWIIVTGTYAKFSELMFKYVYEYLLGERSYSTLLVAFPNKSVEADQALWELSEAARGREELRDTILHAEPEKALELLRTSESSRDWLERFDLWLDIYGHRVFELDILHETISDSPAIALQMVRNFIESDSQSPSSRQNRKAEERKNAEIGFQRALTAKWFIKPIVERIFRLAQRYAALRESRPFYLHLGWPMMRRDVAELGRRLTKSGVLREAGNVFFLTADELRKWSIELDQPSQRGEARDQYQLVRQRRSDWEKQKSVVPPLHINPNFLVRYLLNDRESVGESSSVLIGTPGSPGKAFGNTCLVKSHSDFGKFKQGQILVAPYTTPVWTLLLSLAAGVVTETGGALSHAAIIAREYGIPAVVGVANAVSRIPDGTNLEVDGSAGRVSLTATRRPV